MAWLSSFDMRLHVWKYYKKAGEDIGYLEGGVIIAERPLPTLPNCSGQTCILLPNVFWWFPLCCPNIIKNILDFDNYPRSSTLWSLSKNNNQTILTIITLCSAYLIGISNCTWSSCRHGCTAEVYKCWQVQVKQHPPNVKPISGPISGSDVNLLQKTLS